MLQYYLNIFSLIPKVTSLVIRAVIELLICSSAKQALEVKAVGAPPRFLVLSSTPTLDAVGNVNC